ncbi:hypothetical protein FQN60_007385 [Etheostoma spectabile]|uniref:Uncharacterized protein n=1 Tax=Etheostoma spectabile TaxID=54343 RepID=A0A5J5CYS6_9PERO|nr:hypothetical protein FQN60_007385 [Etheostoma spectabile]
MHPTNGAPATSQTESGMGESAGEVKVLTDRYKEATAMLPMGVYRGKNYSFSGGRCAQLNSDAAADEEEEYWGAKPGEMEEV